MILVYVGGEVVHPEAYSMPAGTTLSAALRQAGGFTEFSHQKAIVVQRGSKRLIVDFRRVRRDMRCDPALQNGDAICVMRETSWR